MQNRFEQGKPSILKRIVAILPIVGFTVVLVLFLRGLGSVSETTQAKQQESLETALSHCISQCYAVEGHYPASVSYMVEHYGLTYDSDVFLIDYSYYGGNLYPEVSVIRKTGASIYDF